MKHVPFIWIWLVFVLFVLVVPWSKVVYFQWDDIEFLMQFRSPDLSTFINPHSYQFIPLFLILYWLETQLFGVTPSLFFLVSVVFHLINILLVYKLTESLTHKKGLAFAGAVLVSFNKSFYPTIFWPALQSNLILTTFTLSSLIILQKLRKQTSILLLISLFLGLIGANLSFAFGIPTGFILSLAVFLSWPHSRQKIGVICTCFSATVFGVLTTLMSSANQLQHNQIFDNFWAGKRLFNLIYFTLVGPTQAIMSRFFIPGFQPNVYQPWNVLVMITIPALISIFVFLSARKMLGNKKKFFSLAPLFIFGGLLFGSYFMAAPLRSAAGAHKALSERYMYYPLFNFILFIVYAFSLIEKDVIKHYRVAKPLLIGSLLIIMIAHFIGMNFYAYHFFTSLR